MPSLLVRLNTNEKMHCTTGNIQVGKQFWKFIIYPLSMKTNREHKRCSVSTLYIVYIYLASKCDIAFKYRIQYSRSSLLLKVVELVTSSIIISYLI